MSIAFYLSELLPRLSKDESLAVSLEMVNDLDRYIRSGATLRVDGGILRLLEGNLVVEVDAAQETEKVAIHEPGAPAVSPVRPRVDKLAA
jgi:hypothetical protein